MSANTVKLLRTAAEIVGGDKALAERLGIGQAILSKFMSGRWKLPDPLLLQAVDIILEDRQPRLARRGQPAAQSRQEPLHDG